MNRLRARTTPITELDDRTLVRWADLADRAVEPNPFLSPAYLATAPRHLPESRDIRLVIVEDDTRMLALVPLSVVDRFRGAPLRYATTAGPFLGNESPLCVPLVDAERPREVMGAVLDHLGSRASGLPGLVELTLMPGDGHWWQVLTGACHDRRVPLYERYRFERAALRLADDSVPPRQALSRSRRRQIARHGRSLQRELGPLVLTDRGDDPEAFEEFVELEAAGWKGDRAHGGGALKVTPGALDWFEDLADEMRPRGDLRLHTVTAGSETVYMSIVLRSGKHLYALMDTYDERYARFGPGTVGRVLEQEHVLEHTDAELFDPCMHPSNAVPTRLYRDRRTITGVLVAPRGLAPRAAVRFAVAARRARSLVTRRSG
ncbi:GNAT family N-acetyltransferase [Isoptericola halotolerans]|uniref:GNAT family N-acetyltransferase n=1 Tax=Isoptericola halotolerans TaxID=300560 RepID=UPI00388F82D9